MGDVNVCCTSCDVIEQGCWRVYCDYVKIGSYLCCLYDVDVFVETH